VNAAFRAKTDLLLLLSKSLQDNGIDPHKFPTTLPDGSVVSVDLVESITKLATQQTAALKRIDDATDDCNNNRVGPEKIIELGNDLSTYASSAALPQGVELGDILSGHPLGGEDALLPKFRDKILTQLNLGGEVANVIRDPICGLRIDGCRTVHPVSPLDTALSKLVAGNVALNNPDRMRVGDSHIVEVKLSTTLSPADLKSQLTEAGNQEAASLLVGDRMSATLNGGDAFDISPPGPQVQWISDSQVTTWTWNVTPKTAGSQYLIMTFDAVITVDGKDGTRNVRTLTHKIDVEIGWPHTPAEWFEFSKKWFDNVNWLWASFLAPIGLLFVGWWRRRVRQQTTSVEPRV
jgi:hypothetical protein